MKVSQVSVEQSFEVFEPQADSGSAEIQNNPAAENSPVQDEKPSETAIDEQVAIKTGLDPALSQELLLRSSAARLAAKQPPDDEPLPITGTAAVNRSPWLQDNRFDGLLVGADGQTYPPNIDLRDIPPILPDNGKTPTDETLIFVNGVANNLGEQVESMQRLANDSGARVLGIHNATERGRDGWQALGDKLGIGRNPASRTLEDLVYREIKAGRTVQVIGHSQGAAIVARALTDVKEKLMDDDNLSRKSAERLLSRVKVETFGGIAARYPDGPQYVHYINMADGANIAGLGPAVLPGGGFFSKLFGGISRVLPGLPGLPKPPVPVNGGRGAVYHRFWSTEANNHNFKKVYSEHRVPFEQARRGDFRR
jgi:hypothetical protein